MLSEWTKMIFFSQYSLTRLHDFTDEDDFVSNVLGTDQMNKTLTKSLELLWGLTFLIPDKATR